MANVIGEVRAQSQAKDITLLKKHASIEVISISDTDTYTVDNMTTVENSTVVNMATGADVTHTKVGNVITIDDAVSDIHVMIFVVGV